MHTYTHREKEGQRERARGRESKRERVREIRYFYKGPGDFALPNVWSFRGHISHIRVHGKWN